MRKQKREYNPQMLSQVQNTPYFHQFQGYLDPQQGFWENQKDFKQFYSYSISRGIEDLIQNDSIVGSHPSEENFEQVFETILQNKQISRIFQILQSKIKRIKSNKNKDIKASFFRTIVKHLKSIQPIDLNGQHESQSETLKTFHRKLCRNTISKKQIQYIFKKYGEEIVEYLGNGQAYKDLLTVNKSLTNKWYYLLHLKEFSIIVRKGGLASYPFFKKRPLKQQIKKMAKAIFNQKWLKSGLEEKQPPKEPSCSFENMFQLDELLSFPFQSIQECHVSHLQMQQVNTELKQSGNFLTQATQDKIFLMDDCCANHEDVLQYK